LDGNRANGGAPNFKGGERKGERLFPKSMKAPRKFRGSRKIEKEKTRIGEKISGKKKTRVDAWSGIKEGPGVRIREKRRRLNGESFY